MAYIAGVDVGGTFTDVTLIDTDSGRVWAAKTPSTPADQSLGFVTGLEKAAALAGLLLAAHERCFHGPTVATNAIFHRRDTRLGLLSTAGFASALEIRLHGRIAGIEDTGGLVDVVAALGDGQRHQVGGGIDQRGQHRLRLLRGEEVLQQRAHDAGVIAGRVTGDDGVDPLLGTQRRGRGAHARGRAHGPGGRSPTVPVLAGLRG